MQGIERLEGGERMQVPSALLGDGGGDRYILRVVGDSMLHDCIRDGDFVIVRRSSTATAGEKEIEHARR